MRWKVVAIRIIPMSSANPEFIGKDINEVQNDFFEGTLKKDNATLSWYYYEKSGIDAEENDLVLFQMDNCIIASAILDNVIHFHENAADSNRGAYILKTNTIKTFNLFFSIKTPLKIYL